MLWFKRSKKSLAKQRCRDSDHGRRFGWFVERDNTCIAELEYVRWDSASQFWHEYLVKWVVPPEQRTKPDPDEWILQKLVLRNRRFSDVVIAQFLTAHRDQDIVMVRFASVSLERFVQEQKTTADKS
jgi:hypothetical protein